VPIPDGDALIKGLEAMVGNAAAAALAGTHVKVTVKPAKGTEEKEAEEEADTVCPNCAMKLSEFRSGGWLGCAECYGSFEEQIGKILMQIHGADGHRGKSYGDLMGAAGKDTQKYVERLRRDLNRAIIDERFEHAATLRDCIRGLGEKKGVK
jgi:protein arginine kinase activator